MINFKKAYSFKIISLITIGLFFLNSIAYGTNLPVNASLRVPMTGQKRVEKAIEAQLHSVNVKSMGALQKIAKFKEMLEAYDSILNEEGKRKLEETRNALVTRNDDVSSFLQAEELASDKPTVKNPRTEWFVNPLNGLDPKRKAALRELQHNVTFSFFGDKMYKEPSGTINITKGCFEPCLNCQFWAGRRIYVMPYPLVIKHLDMMKAWGITDVILFFDSEAFNYYDPYYDADLGDIVEYLYSIGLKTQIITHGYDPNDTIAQRAAQKIASSKHDISIAVSYHLFHEDIIKPIEEGQNASVTSLQLYGQIKECREATKKLEKIKMDHGYEPGWAAEEERKPWDKLGQMIAEYVITEDFKELPIVDDVEAVSKDAVIISGLPVPSQGHRFFIGPVSNISWGEYKFRCIGEVPQLESAWEAICSETDGIAGAFLGRKGFKGVPKETIRKYADRFTNAIRTLAPKITEIREFSGNVDGADSDSDGFDLYRECMRQTFEIIKQDLGLQEKFEYTSNNTRRSFLCIPLPDKVINIARINTSMEALGKGAVLVERLKGRLKPEEGDDQGIVCSSFPQTIFNPTGDVQLLTSDIHYLKLRDIFEGPESSDFITFLKMIKQSFKEDATDVEFSQDQFRNIFYLYLPIFVDEKGLQEIATGLERGQVGNLSPELLKHYFKLLSNLPIHASSYDSLKCNGLEIKLADSRVKPEIGTLRLGTMIRSFIGPKIMRLPIGFSGKMKDVKALYDSPRATATDL